MKCKLAISITAAALVIGCVSPSRYVLHDRVENDWWTGKTHEWGPIEQAKQMPYFEVYRNLGKMRLDEEGGYANVGPEEDRPIEVQRVRWP